MTAQQKLRKGSNRCRRCHLRCHTLSCRHHLCHRRHSLSHPYVIAVTVATLLRRHRRSTSPLSPPRITATASTAPCPRTCPCAQPRLPACPTLDRIGAPALCLKQHPRACTLPQALRAPGLDRPRAEALDCARAPLLCTSYVSHVVPCTLSFSYS